MSLHEMTPAEYAKLTERSHEYLRAMQDAAERSYAIGSYERYDWNQETAELVFSDQGVARVVARIQFVGTISTTSGTWLWSWANPSILEGLKERMRLVREFGRDHGIEKLTSAEWEADEVDGWEMTAIACYVLQSRGAYRSPDQDGFTFMVLTAIDWASPA